MSAEQTRRILRITIYFMLVLSAGTTFFFSERLWVAARGGDLPIWAALLAPVAFTIFVIVFSVDRLRHIQKRIGSSGRALVQIGVGLVFLSLLWPEQAAEFKNTRKLDRARDVAVRLMDHKDAAFRSAGCELIGLRNETRAIESVRSLARNDKTAEVRQTCQNALERLVSVNSQ